jgi:hypothetical protein
MLEQQRINPRVQNGVGERIDWDHLREASLEDQSYYLGTFGSYQRTEAIAWLMLASPPLRCLKIFCKWGNMCDAPWPWRSDLARELRRALGQVSLREALQPSDLVFYDALPATIAVWRGCERGRERGLSWTVERAVAEGFARGKRCINRNPTLVRADIPRQHVFAVFTDRNEQEVVLDPRRLCRFEKKGLKDLGQGMVRAAGEE